MSDTPARPLPPPEILYARQRLLLWLAGQAARHGLPWLLRGSVLTWQLIHPAPREIKDVDWVDPGAIDVPAWSAALPRLLQDVPPGFGAVEPGLLLHPFADSPFPGVRLPFTVRDAPGAPVSFDGQPWESHIEVTGGDPLTAPPIQTAAGIPAVSAEDLFAWKVHGLFEYGRGKWRAKDLLDLALLLRHAPPDPAALPAALRAAFRNRQTSFGLTLPMIFGEWGRSFSAGRKWRKFRKHYAHVREELEEVRDPVADVLVPILREELERELAEGWRAVAVERPEVERCEGAENDRLAQSFDG